MRCAGSVRGLGPVIQVPIRGYACTCLRILATVAHERVSVRCMWGRSLGRVLFCSGLLCFNPNFPFQGVFGLFQARASSVPRLMLALAARTLWFDSRACLRFVVRPTTSLTSLCRLAVGSHVSECLTSEATDGIGDVWSNADRLPCNLDLIREHRIRKGEQQGAGVLIPLLPLTSQFLDCENTLGP